MPLIWSCLGFAAGILSADLLNLDLTAWLVILAGVCLAGGAMLGIIRRRSWDQPGWPPVLILAVLISYCLGACRYQLSLPAFEDPGFITHYLDSAWPVEVVGVVVDYPDRREQVQNLRMKIQSLHPQGAAEALPVWGTLLARVEVEIPVSYGDQLSLTGYLEEPPEGEDFSYRTYLARKGIYAYQSVLALEVLQSRRGNPLLQAIYDLRERSLQRLYLLWPDPEASLLAGILLGVESGISESVQRAFRETGTTHIIAISGFNITIVAGMFARLFSRVFSSRQAAGAALLGIILYTLLVGADPAVVRAAVMGGLGIFARQIGRRQHGLNAAALASLIMILIQPGLLWDISFQLSLAATLGLILYAEPLAAWFLNISSRFLPLRAAERITQPVSEYFLFTIAAQLTTLPVMIYHFHSFSISTLLANPAILPVQPPIMVLGGLALILSLVWLPLGRAAAPLVYPFVLFTIRAVEWFSSLPIKSIQVGQIGLVWIFGFYLLLVVLTFGRGLLIPLSRFIQPASAVGVLALAVLLTWRSAFSAPDGKLHLYLLDVGMGSAVYLESPGGQRVLINGGPSTRALSDQLGRRTRPFSRELDLVVVASPLEQDLDALVGTLPRFEPDQVIWLGDPGLCWEAENLRKSLADQRIPVQYAQAGQTLVFQDGLRLQILSVSSRGGTILIEFGAFRALFPFGLREDDRQAWRQGSDLGQVSVYHLADNGYQSSNPPSWISRLNPQLLLLSVGLEDSRGLPDRGLIDQLGGYSLLRTDQQGTIHLSTDGARLWIQVASSDGL